MSSERSTEKSAQKTATSKDKIVFYNFKILHRLGRPLGLSCYTLPDKYGTLSIKVTTLDIMLFSFVFFLNSYLTFYNYQFWDKVFKLHKKDMIFSIGIKLITTGSLLFTLTCAIIVFLMRDRIWYIVVTLQDIVTEAEKYDMKLTNTGKLSLLAYYLLLSIATIYSIFIAYSVYMVTYLGYFDFIYLFSHVKATLTFAYACWKCQFLICVIGMRFYLLNAMFEKRIVAALIEPNGIGDPQMIGDLIFTVAEFHDTLNSLVGKLNDYFAIVILPIYGGNFAITVFSCHNLYKTFVSNDSTFYYLTLFFLILAIYSNILVTFITLGAEWTKKMADHLGVLVHKSTAKTQNKQILQKLHIISQQVLHVTPTFSCGLFDVDWPMQFTFVSALTSYLIILIQFQDYVNSEPIPEQNGSLPMYNLESNN